MQYTPHNYKSGDKLFASDLNQLETAVSLLSTASNIRAIDVPLNRQPDENTFTTNSGMAPAELFDGSYQVGDMFVQLCECKEQGVLFKITEINFSESATERSTMTCTKLTKTVRRKKVIWENASPSSQFNTQSLSVTIPYNNYDDCLEIVFKNTSAAVLTGSGASVEWLTVTLPLYHNGQFQKNGRIVEALTTHTSDTMSRVARNVSLVTPDKVAFTNCLTEAGTAYVWRGLYLTF